MDDLDSPDTVNNPDVAKKVIDRVNLDIGGLGTKTTPLSRVMLATLPSTGIGVAHHFVSRGVHSNVRARGTTPRSKCRPNSNHF